MFCNDIYILDVLGCVVILFYMMFNYLLRLMSADILPCRPPLARSYLASVPPLGGYVSWVLWYQGKRWASPKPRPPWGEGTEARYERARGGGVRWAGCRWLASLAKFGGQVVVGWLRWQSSVGRLSLAGFVGWVRLAASISPKFGVRWAGCRWLASLAKFGGQVVVGWLRWLGSFGGFY